MTKSFFATSLFIFLFVSNASAWDMGAYVESAQAGEGKTDSTRVQKTSKKQPEAADSSMALTNNHVYRGLYFSAEVAFGYTSLNYSVNTWRGKSVQKFSGLSFPYAEIRFGHYFANIVSVYSALGIGIGTGEYEASSQTQDKAKIDAVSFRGLLGLGAEVYPFQDKESALYGLYLGLCVGGAVERAQDDNERFGYTYRSADPDLEIFDNTFIRFEVGYSFWIDNRWRVGPAFSYSFGKYDSNDDDNVVTTTHNFNLAIKIAL